MREVAIIQLLAQMGSFVPAKLARLGICDFLFNRLGASDDILMTPIDALIKLNQLKNQLELN